MFVIDWDIRNSYVTALFYSIMVIVNSIGSDNPSLKAKSMIKVTLEHYLAD